MKLIKNNTQLKNSEHKIIFKLISKTRILYTQRIIIRNKNLSGNKFGKENYKNGL